MVSHRRLRGAASALAIVLAAALSSGQGQAFVWPNVPEQIARQLSSGDVSERRLAAQRLSELPQEIALGLIRRAVHDPDIEVRLRVAQAAIDVRMPMAGDLVVSWLSEGDARLRLSACSVVRASPTDRSVAALGRVLGDPDPHVRIEAAAAMGASGLADAVSPLLGHLDDSAPEVRAEVARALGRLGDGRAVVPLIGKVQDSVPEVRRAVARALGELGDLRAASALMLALVDGAQDVRMEAVGALGKLRSDDATLAIAPLVETNASGDSSALPALFPGQRRAAASGSEQVRIAALRALGRIGTDNAVKVLVAALAKDDPNALRSPVREALVEAGSVAVGQLVSVLSGSPSPNLAAGAALSLGQLRATGAMSAVVRAMQRGIVPQKHGLVALARMGDPNALPAVLELLADRDPSVRKEAIVAAIALLDPSHPDGRAVDPARAGIFDPEVPLDEKIGLVRLLGRTAAPRAQAVLLPLVKTKTLALRLAVLEALGTLGSSSTAVDAALLEALGDENAELRLRAAMALSRVASGQAASKLLERLSIAAEEDRGALGIALSGALSRAGGDTALAQRVGNAVSTAPDVAKDALLEGLGRMRSAEGGRVLAGLAPKATIDDRRKIAEALAGHPDLVATLRVLAGDPDPGVRANAVWSIGAVGKEDAITLLAGLLRDPDVAVAGNAAAALGRIAARQGTAARVAGLLCKVLSDPRSYVRANALTGLSLAGGACDAGVVRTLLAQDRSEAVRLAAADALARAVVRAGTAAAATDRRALVRCAEEDKNASVASRCARGVGPGTRAGTAAAGPVQFEDIAVFIVPDGRGTPVPRAPFALVRPDGLLRLGTADRRGEIFEFHLPRGIVRLAVPAPLAR